MSDTTQQIIDSIKPGTPYVVNNVLYNADSIVATWVQEQLGEGALVEVGFKALGIVDPNTNAKSIRDRIIAGCYFYGQRGDKDIWVTAAMVKAAATHRGAIRQILSYPFEQLGMERISAEIDDANTRSVEQAQILGFVREGTKRMRGATWGYWALYRDQCPFWSNH